MKSKSFFVATVIAAILLPATIFAQDKTARTAPTAPYCDAVLKKETDALQKKADEQGRTMTTCIECIERTTKIKICANLVVQPRKGTGRNGNVAIIEVPSVDDADLAGNGGKRPNFQVDILQDACTAKGVSLTASVPGHNFWERPSTGGAPYSYAWTTDDKKAGHESKIECACGGTATVRVTQLATGHVVVAKAKLPPCAPDK